jgi:hypothetical protein
MNERADALVWAAVLYGFGLLILANMPEQHTGRYLVVAVGAIAGGTVFAFRAWRTWVR